MAVKTLYCRFDRCTGLVTGPRRPLTTTEIYNGDVAKDLHGRWEIRSGVSSVQKDCSFQNCWMAEKMRGAVVGNAMQSLAEVGNLVKDTNS